MTGHIDRLLGNFLDTACEAMSLQGIGFVLVTDLYGITIFNTAYKQQAEVMRGRHRSMAEADRQFAAFRFFFARPRGNNAILF